MGIESVKPRLGFLGLGWIGLQRMAAIVSSGEAEVVALADPVKDLIAKAAELAPKAAQTRTLEELLKNEMAGVVIATPSALHASQTVNVLNRGAAVFCQKPLGRSLIEVRSVIEAAKAADRLLGVDLSYRFTAAMGHLRRLVQSGGVGRNLCRRAGVSQCLRTTETLVLRSAIVRRRLCHGSGNSLSGRSVVGS